MNLKNRTPAPLDVVKIGGSLLSSRGCANEVNHVSLRLAALYLKTSGRPAILVHGTGFTSKSFARCHNIQNRTIEGSKKKLSVIVYICCERSILKC